ncbi:MAG: hypothetical protein HDR86_00825 [Bacteroides sp.]|nr:hypothetical protein [Bacteroides sp.]
MSDTTKSGRIVFKVSEETLSAYMKLTTDIIERANERTIARVSRFGLHDTSAVLPDGSIQVSVTYRGINYSQQLTPEKLNESFRKALSSHDKKEIQ